MSLKSINIFEEWALEDKALSPVPGLGGRRRIKGKKKKKCWRGDKRWSKVEVLKMRGPREQDILRMVVRLQEEGAIQELNPLRLELVYQRTYT